MTDSSNMPATSETRSAATSADGQMNHVTKLDDREAISELLRRTRAGVSTTVALRTAQHQAELVLRLAAAR